MQRSRAVFAFSVLAAIGYSAAQSATAQVATQSSEPRVHVYRQVEGVDLRAYVFPPTLRTRDSAVAGVLLFHGGGWVAGSPDWVFASARRFAAMGLVAIPIEYRLSTAKVTPIDALADVCGAFAWARREAAALGLDPNRLAAYGVSAGGHLAAAAATVGCVNRGGAYGIGGPDALVLWSPALDVSGDGHFRRLLLDRATVAAYSPVEHVRPGMPPTSLVHGDKDSLTPLTGARRSVTWCPLVAPRAT